MTTAEQHETRVKMVGMIQGIPRYAVAVSGSLGQVVGVGWETIWDAAWWLYLCNLFLLISGTYMEDSCVTHQRGRFT
ncbi:hypothetical protein IW262DRAFT_1047970 [Armillaria fumosa]|nr:hypothetical protein IW262DRAFT_1047970 [Armillaria fumosa]